MERGWWALPVSLTFICEAKAGKVGGASPRSAVTVTELHPQSSVYCFFFIFQRVSS